jgi:hypothetical protein
MTRFDEEEAPPSRQDDVAGILGSVLGWGNRLFGLGRKALAAQSVDILEVDGTLRVYGTQSSREVLGFRSMVNWALPENESLILQSTRAQTFGALTSPGMPIGLGINIVTDGARFVSGEYDNTHLAAALTVDTGVTVGSALLAGAVAGAVAGALVGGSLGFVVGALPAAVVGAVLGAGAALWLSSTFVNSGVRDYVVDEVADMYGDWTGQ